MSQFKQQVRSSAVRRMSAALLLGAAFGTMAIALPAPVQAQESQASLRGTITPAGGAQQITAVQVATNARRTVLVTESGSYNFPSLRPGLYRLEIVTPDGVEQTDEFDLLVAQNAILDFDLAELAAGPATPDTGNVIGGAPVQGNTILVTGARIRSLEGAEVGDVVTRRELELLPQNNRNFLAFADTAPGVQFVTEGGGNTRLQGGAQSGRAVNVFIDGISQKDFVLRGGITGQDTSPGNPFPQLAIGEYRVIASNYKAEFDQVGSVAITAITRSGTNEIEGEAFYDFTNQDLRSARPSEGDEKAVTDEKQFGGAIGGPIIPDMLFFFATYEGKRIDSPYTVTPGAGLDVSALPAQYQDLFGVETDGLRADLLFYKLDFLPTDRDLFQLSVKYRDETSDNGNDGATARERLAVTEVEELRGLFRYERTNDNWVNDFKVSYEDVSWAPTPSIFGNGNIFELGQQGLIVAFGGGPNFQDKGQEGWTIQDDFTWIGGENHTVKAGVKFKWVQLNTLQLNNFNPQYTFNTLFNPAMPMVPGSGPFNDSIPYRVVFGASTGAGDPRVSSDNFQFGIYIQDDWVVSDRLTLNLGIRWDYEETPGYLDYVHAPTVIAAVQPANYPNLIGANYNINNFISTGSEREPFMGAIQPRIGFSYVLDEEARFTLFGGYGRSYDRNQFDFLQQEIIQGTFSTRAFNFQTGDPLRDCAPISSTCRPFDPVFLTEAGRQQLLAGTPGGTGGFELRFIDNDLKVPYSDQFSLGLRSQFNLWDVEIGYRHIASRDGFAYLLGNRRGPVVDRGLFFPSNAPPNAPFGFAPPGFGSIIYGTNGLTTDEDVAHIKVDKRYTEFSPWNLTATYTFTEAEENRSFGETFSLDYPSLDDYPVIRSSGVPRHRLVTVGAVDTFLGLTLSGRVVLRSNPFLKGFINQQQPPFERLIVGTVGEGDWTYQVDLALTKYIGLPFLSDDARIRLRADVLNVFDRANFTGFNGNPNDNTRTQGSPTIFGERVGRGTGGNPPRTLKLTAGFSF